MADEEHVALLKQGVEVWNKWRKENPDIRPDLSGADLTGADLGGADLHGADLDGANLRGADLSRRGPDRRGPERREPGRREPASANLGGATCAARTFQGRFYTRRYSGIPICRRAKGLETCRHWGPSIIDHRTLQRSGPLPLAFLRGVGLPDNLIDYLPSLLNQPIQFYSCFISYSSKDQEFADRLHADLQNKGVRCWFAPHDMPIGAKIIDAIDEAIRLRDKVLLILSEHSIASDWVEDEVTQGLGRGAVPQARSFCSRSASMMP